MGQAALILLLILTWAASVRAQMPIPPEQPVNGATLFRNQCATCHSLKASDPPRQGPHLEHVYGRKIGSVESYKYTPGYREAGAVWTDENLDRYLTNPAAMFPGSTMAYRQPKAATRKAIIDYLKEQR